MALPEELKTTEVTNGPAFLRIDDEAISHTQGGITVNITPSSRNRTVDFYGESPVAVIHTGDEARVTAPLAQWSAAVLQNIYDPGNDQTGATEKYMGIGRSAGYVYVPRKVEVIPVAASMAAKKIELFKCCPVGQLEIAHSHDADRILNVEMIAIVDESQDDGELIGRLYLGGGSGGGGSG